MTTRASHLNLPYVASLMLLAALTGRVAMAEESAAGFVVSMDGTWRLESPTGEALKVGATVPPGARIYATVDGGDAQIEIALFNSPTLLRLECGDVSGCPPLEVPRPRGKATLGTSVLRAVQRLFIEGGPRYEVVTAGRSIEASPAGLQSSVLTRRDDRWTSVPSLLAKSAAQGHREYPVRRIGDDGLLASNASVGTISVTRGTRGDTIEIGDELEPGLYDVWDRRGDDRRVAGQQARMGTWVLLAPPEHARDLQRSFADASEAIQWNADTRTAVLRAYLLHLWQETRGHDDSAAP